MLSDYANQSLTWGVAGTPDEYNKITYTPSTIKGRKETSNKLVRDSNGQETLVGTVVFTESAISVNDQIDGKAVISVEDCVNLEGITEFKECYLK